VSLSLESYEESYHTLGSQCFFKKEQKQEALHLCYGYHHILNIVLSEWNQFSIKLVQVFSLGKQRLIYLTVDISLSLFS